MQEIYKKEHQTCLVATYVDEEILERDFALTVRKCKRVAQLYVLDLSRRKIWLSLLKIKSSSCMISSHTLRKAPS